MTTITIQRPAKCKDCKHHKAYYLNKKKGHWCANPKSTHNGLDRRLDDFVCDKWEI